MTIPETHSRIRRGIASLVAAADIAFAGTPMLPSEEAQAAGVQTTNYTNIYAAPTSPVVAASDTVRKDA